MSKSATPLRHARTAYRRLRRTFGPAGRRMRRTFGPAGRRLRRTLTPARRAAASRRTVTALGVIAVTLAGVLLGLALGGRTVTDVGPFHAELSLHPSLAGTTSVHVPPLGSLHFDSHEGPTQITVALGSLDQARTQAIVDQPDGFVRASQTVADDVIDGVVRLGFGSLGAAMLGAMVLAALVFRDTRRVAWAGGLALVMVAGSLGVAAGTFRFTSVEEPRYEGLLVNAPALVGDVQRIANEWEQYAEGLQKMVTNVSLLYTTVSTLPEFSPDADLTRVLHVTDLHLNPNAWPIMRTLVEQYEVDFIIDTGDIVDWGTAQESVYVEEVGTMQVPYVYIRGNHDSESVTQAAIAEQPNAVVLDDQIVTVDGLTIGGIGDPRFTPDRSTDPFADDPEISRQRVIDSGEQLAQTIAAYPGPVDIAAVHDPLAAGPLDGWVPYVLAGHRHERQVERLSAPPPDAPDADGTLLMVQGSTGGAGLRGLEGEHPEPLAMSVLYFDDEQAMVAYDDITIGGHGQSEVSLQRHIVEQGSEDQPDLRDGEGLPSPSPTSSPSPPATSSPSPSPSPTP